jgi:hypothetical protein
VSHQAERPEGRIRLQLLSDERHRLRAVHHKERNVNSELGLPKGALHNGHLQIKSAGLSRG